ncbi:MarC family protein [Kiritimatiella glycovorans]|uniref:UPF0056 membrane protein n=1 Tax=Kiritimatiella glycovorans TaxID=1307763 RepID=A0A0G3EH42_9BACT|nr:MarC family protein [Kiritimatiella glycovorans]AKJ63454.1 inner membrane protein [Kiritimatiella glycovorans]
MEPFLNITGFMLIMLNPFLVVIYLLDLIEKMSFSTFWRELRKAAYISAGVFAVFALLGDAIFSADFKQHFASFQIFGGIVFLLIGIQFMFRGNMAIESLRGESEYAAGSIAMPILIGPGTISASVLAGERLDMPLSVLAVVTAVVISALTIALLKKLHDYVRPRNEILIQRYIEVAGRVVSLFVGSVSVEMIMQGAQTWISVIRNG